MTDLYETLGVAKDAARDTIKKAFRRRARETHPDVGGDPAKFHAVELAHRILTDDERRAEYDATGRIDDAVDTLESEAASVIGGVVERFVADENAKYRDLVGEMKKSLQADVATANRERDEGQHFIVRTENLRSRLHGQRGKDLIDRMLARKIEQAKAALKAIDHQVAVRELALKLIDDASFDADKQPAGSGYGAGIMGAMRSQAEMNDMLWQAERMRNTTHRR